MPGRQTGSRTRTPAPPVELGEVHETVQETALELAGGDRRRIQVVDARTVRVVNPH